MMAVALVLGGCQPSSLGIGRLEPMASTPLPEIAVDAELGRNPDVAAALREYSSGRPDVASALVNRALQGDPGNTRLHFLNGQIYLAWSKIGFPQYRDLAGVAFRLALQNDPSNLAAARALGAFYSGQGAYPSAVIALAEVINLNPGDWGDLWALARATYLAGQPTVAKWAIDTALSTPGAEEPGPGFLALAALASAAAGDALAATSFTQRYAAAVVEPAKVAQLERAVTEWPAIRAAATVAAAAARREARARRATSPRAATETPPARPTPVVPPPPPPPAIPGTEPLAPEELPPPAPPQEVTGRPVSSRWDVCDSPPNDIDPGNMAAANNADNVGSTSYSSTLTVVDPNSSSITAPLLSLPSPCADEPAPRMALIDVVVIRVAGLTSTRLGINLLDQLQIVLGGSITNQTVIASNAPNTSTTTIVGSIGLPAAGITYSLNIANAFDLRSEVVARPTLVALDRRSSHYFSGQSLVAGLPGGTYGGSSFIEIPTGVDLFVVPTFIDDDDLLLSVRASRSSFEEQIDSQLQSGFQDQILTARNAVTASVAMKMGETLILSGLTERALDQQSDRVPGLGDVPGLNLGFNERVTAEANNSVLIIMTPRRTDGRRQDGGAPIGYRPEEATAFQAMLTSRAKAAGLNPDADAQLATSLNPASRAVVFPMALLPPAEPAASGNRAKREGD